VGAGQIGELCKGDRGPEWVLARAGALLLEVPVTDPCTSRHVEIKDDEQTVAAAQVAAPQQAGGTARASLHAAPGHVPPGTRARLVDAVLDLPEVRASGRLRATVPLGDTESLWRLRERTKDADTRPAGSTALVDADIPPQGGRDPVTSMTAQRPSHDQRHPVASRCAAPPCARVRAADR
jgi:hypothetical protein